MGKEEPVYQSIKKTLEEKINMGEYQSGDKIPSERELSAYYNISRMTARQALNELVKEGIVFREKGRGTFVSNPKLLQENCKSFTDTLKEQGYTPSTSIIELSTVYQLKEISTILQLAPSTEYYKIKRLRFGNDIPMALETIYIPKEKCPGLIDHDLTQSLYKLLRSVYQYTVENISYDMDACISNAVLMRVLKLSKPRALLKCKGVSCITGGEKLFYEESYYRSDLYKFHVDVFKR